MHLYHTAFPQSTLKEEANDLLVYISFYWPPKFGARTPNFGGELGGHGLVLDTHTHPLSNSESVKRQH